MLMTPLACSSQLQPVAWSGLLFSLLLCFFHEATCMPNDVIVHPAHLGCFLEEWTAAISFPGVSFLPLFWASLRLFILTPLLELGKGHHFPFLSSLSLGRYFCLFLAFTKPAPQFISSFHVFYAPDNVCCPTTTYFPYLPFCWWSASHRIV